MEKKNLGASVLVFDDREPSEVRSAVAGALDCKFDDESAKSDEFGVTWFGDTFGFEICFQLMSHRDDGAWYSVTVASSCDLIDPEAPMEEIDFHVSQMLRRAGFRLVVTMSEYRASYRKPRPS